MRHLTPWRATTRDSAAPVEFRPHVVRSPAPAASPPRPMPATRPAAKEKDQSIETLRGLAIFCVVAGHVIGDLPNTGLRVEPGSIYRYLYDAGAYLRLPMFFVISGFLYAHRPAVPGGFAEFAKGKARLLLLPFLSVATLQFLMKSIIPGVNISTSIRDIWRIYVYGFDQFWYLQAVMCTFSLVLIMEKIIPSRNPLRWAAYALLAIAFDRLVPKTTFFSLNMFSRMLPFFFLGCLLYRPSDRLRGPLAVLAITLVFMASLMIQQLVWFSRLTLTDEQANLLRLCEGSSCTFLAFRFRWAIPSLAMLGKFAYPIFLFHVFGSAGSRILAGRFGIDNRFILFALGTACGLALPIAVDLIFQRNAILRRVFLGRR